MSILENKIGDSLDEFESAIENDAVGLKTQFKVIDGKLGCLPGLVGLVGDPKAGKSTFLLNLVLRNAQNGVPVLMFDQENGRKRLQLRMLCCLGDLTKEAVETRQFVKNEKKQYERAKKELEELPIYQTPMLEFNELEDMIVEIGKKHREHVLVVIDSLNRLVKDYENRRADIDKWLGLFNELKEKYAQKITIIFVSEKGQSELGKSNVNKAKESSSIVYLAELLINIYRKPDENFSRISIPYNRDGVTGVLAKLKPNIPYTYKLNDSDLY